MKLYCQYNVHGHLWPQLLKQQHRNESNDENKKYPHMSVNGVGRADRMTTIQKFWTYKVCSNSIRIGIVVVVHWVGCVCNQSWHVRTSLSNSWHKLQVAVFAQLAVVGHRSNTCVYVIAIFTMCESTEQRICIKFCFKIKKTTMETYQLLQQYTSFWLVPLIQRG